MARRILIGSCLLAVGAAVVTLTPDRPGSRADYLAAMVDTTERLLGAEALACVGRVRAEVRAEEADLDELVSEPPTRELVSDRLLGCADLRAAFELGLTQDGGLTPGLAGCVTNELGPADFERFIVLGLIGGPQAVANDSDLGRAMYRAGTRCAHAQ